jgi:hypothetical protein
VKRSEKKRFVLSKGAYKQQDEIWVKTILKNHLNFTGEILVK